MTSAWTRGACPRVPGGRDPARGMKAKFDARGLLTHAASGFRERGIAGSLAWDPTPSSGLGPSLTLRQSVGVSATGGVEAVLYSDTVRRLSANDDGDELEWRRFEAVLGCRAHRA